MSHNKGVLPVTGVALSAVAGAYVGWGLALVILGVVLLLAARTFRRRALEAPVYEDQLDGELFSEETDTYYSDAELYRMYEGH